MGLPPLSLSILGVEPLDEFIKEVADFVHHMIVTRPEHLGGVVEVEAKIGLIVDRAAGGRLKLPVLVETGECALPSFVRLRGFQSRVRSVVSYACGPLRLNRRLGGRLLFSFTLSAISSLQLTEGMLSSP